MAGNFAGKINAKKLVLTHFSQRYKGVDDNAATKTDNCDCVAKLGDQAKNVFTSGSTVAAEDFMVIEISRKQ